MIKALIKISFIVLLAGCSLTQGKYSDEKMYDIAAQVKDLSQAVDGYLKFGDATGLSGRTLLLKAVNNDENKLTFLDEYTLKVDIQGDNAVLLVCDGDKALIEDAGCNLALDKAHWQQQGNNTCQITLQAAAVCQ